MKVELPHHVASFLNLNEEEVLEKVSQAVDLVDNIQGPLNSTSSKAVFRSLLGVATIKNLFEIQPSTRDIYNWGFRVIELDGTECAKVVEIPALNKRATLPPTNAEDVLIRAWLSTSTLTDSNNSFRGNIVVFEWLPSASAEAKTVIRGMSGVSLQPNTPIPPSKWASAVSISLSGTSRLLRTKDSQLARSLFVEASIQSIPRWRFLSLYRILEHGYLETLFDDLAARFFSEPRESVESVERALKNEVAQFVKLVEAHNLTDHFREIYTINESLVQSGNKFAILIKREVDRETESDVVKKGIRTCYQIRCSIVHSGVHKVVFDKSDGGEEALIKHIVELQNAVATFLSIASA